MEINPWASKAVAIPGSRDDTGKASIVTIDDDGALRNTSEGAAGQFLGKAEATKFGRLAARADCLVQDRMDVQFAVNAHGQSERW